MFAFCFNGNHLVNQSVLCTKFCVPASLVSLILALNVLTGTKARCLCKQLVANALELILILKSLKKNIIKAVIVCHGV
jgi:hypothetical protein